MIDDDYFARLRDSKDRARVAALVHGRPLWDWIPNIDQMKRDGELADALQLTRECIAAMEAYSSILGYSEGAAGWYKREAIILRKMGDYAAEVWLIEDVQRRYPSHGFLNDREARARALMERHA